MPEEVTMDHFAEVKATMGQITEAVERIATLFRKEYRQSDYTLAH